MSLKRGKNLKNPKIKFIIEKKYIIFYEFKLCLKLLSKNINNFWEND